VTASTNNVTLAEARPPEPREAGERRWRYQQAASWTALAGILFAGAVLRLWQINHLGLNSDEAVYGGQAASIAGDSTLNHLFPIYRAHPLLFQTLLSLPYHFGNGDHDLFGRVAAAVVGLGTVLLTYATGRLLYGRRTGLFAALFMAVMPFSVLVSRQVLLDGPEAFFALLALYLTGCYAIRQRPAWFYAAGGAIGLTFLSKETGILFVASMYAFLALTPSIRVRLREVAIAALVMAVVIAPYPLSLLFAGATGTGGHFLSYQIFRRPNHDLLFYPTDDSYALGPLLVAVALIGLWFLRRRGSWRETLLLSWIIVPVAFFELWPVKGFQYLLPIAAPLAVLAGRTLSVGLGTPTHLPRVGGVGSGAAGGRLAGSSGVGAHPASDVPEIPRRVRWRTGRSRGWQLDPPQHPRRGRHADDRAVDGQHPAVLRAPGGLWTVSEPQPAAPQPGLQAD
jgi:4-amino-4-deoxy-L-arabinose transferase-like glycosyltransferase